jgi:hypothetical protein
MNTKMNIKLLYLKNAGEKWKHPEWDRIPLLVPR